MSYLHVYKDYLTTVFFLFPSSLIFDSKELFLLLQNWDKEYLLFFMMGKLTWREVRKASTENWALFTVNSWKNYYKEKSEQLNTCLKDLFGSLPILYSKLYQDFNQIWARIIWVKIFKCKLMWTWYDVENWYWSEEESK